VPGCRAASCSRQVVLSCFLSSCCRRTSLVLAMGIEICLVSTLSINATWEKSMQHSRKCKGIGRKVQSTTGRRLITIPKLCAYLELFSHCCTPWVLRKGVIPRASTFTFDLILLQLFYGGEGLGPGWTPAPSKGAQRQQNGSWLVHAELRLTCTFIELAPN
jgi:hypothetical protein